MLKKIKKAFRFLIAKIKWHLSGSQARSPKEMQKIYTICESCSHFLRGQGFSYSNEVVYDQCGVCGCNLHPSEDKMNKLYYDISECPEGKW